MCACPWECDVHVCVTFVCVFIATCAFFWWLSTCQLRYLPLSQFQLPYFKILFFFLPAGFSVATISEVLAGPFPFRPSFSQRCSLFMCVTYPHPWLWTSPLPVLLKINVDISVMTAGLAIGRGFEYFQHTVCNFAIRRALMTGRWRLLPSLLNRMHSKWNSAPSHK